MQALLLVLLLAQTAPAPASQAARAVVLDIAQDGGVPHAGCQQALCREARTDPAKRRRVVASLGLAEIPHPLVPETLGLTASVPNRRGRHFFVPLNHTNRLLWDQSAIAELERRGWGVAREGQTVPLAAGPE